MNSTEHGENIGSVILHHVSNSDVLIPLHLFGHDISVTKHVLMLWIAGGLVILAFLLGTRRYRREDQPIPSGFSNFLEFIVDFVHNQIVVPNIGRRYAVIWSPVILAFFSLILTANFLGLIPTGSLALITFLAVIVAGSLAHGIIGHWRNMAPKGVPWPVLFILIPIELLGMFVRPFALTMRLAANMTAGHIAMLAILAPIFLMANPWVGIGSVALNVGINFLEIIVALVQAYVFTLLSAVFIGAAIHVEH
jgi:F-type H+-transporting ATPase subunit a